MARSKSATSNAAIKRRVARAAKAAKANGGVGAGPAIKLTVEDRRWFENVLLKRELIQSESRAKLAAIDGDASELAKTLSEREGVDISQYDLDWKALTGKRKTASETEPEAVPGPAPQPEA